MGLCRHVVPRSTAVATRLDVRVSPRPKNQAAKGSGNCLEKAALVGAPASELPWTNWPTNYLVGGSRSTTQSFRLFSARLCGGRMG